MYVFFMENWINLQGHSSEYSEVVFVIIGACVVLRSSTIF